MAEEKSSKSSSSSGGGGNFGLGVTLFGPTGITAKYRMDEKKAIEGSLGLSGFGYGNNFYLHGVFLYNFHTIEQVNFYLGGGLSILSHKYRGRDVCKRGICIFEEEETRTHLGIRVPVGVSWMPNKQFELSAELFMHLHFVNDVGAGVGLALAARYYF